MPKDTPTPDFLYTPRGPVVSEVEECPLTQRERQCLELIGAGYVTKQVADIIGRKERTVNFHVQNVLRKLNVPNRYIAVRVAIAKNWITL